MASICTPPEHPWANEKLYPTTYQSTFVQPLPTPPAESRPPLSSYDQYSSAVAAGIAYRPSMVPEQDLMVAHNSFTSRRPNASHLPNFELPPPQGVASAQKYPGSYLGSTQSAVPGATLTSVGNLLTPPGNNSTDGISPVSSSATTGSSISNSNPITPFAPPPMAYQTANPATAYGNASVPTVGVDVGAKSAHTPQSTINGQQRHDGRTYPCVSGRDPTFSSPCTRSAIKAATNTDILRFPTVFNPSTIAFPLSNWSFSSTAEPYQCRRTSDEDVTRRRTRPCAFAPSASPAVLPLAKAI